MAARYNREVRTIQLEIETQLVVDRLMRECFTGKSPRGTGRIGTPDTHPRPRGQEKFDWAPILSGWPYPRTSGGSWRRNSHGRARSPLQPQPSAANATQTYGSNHALSRGLAIWSQKSASCAKAISLRKFSDLKSMPRTVGVAPAASSTIAPSALPV